MEQKYLDYALNALEKIVNIPSPSGYAKEVSAFLMQELESMGYEPKRTNKGGVTVDLGGPEGNALLLCCHVDTLGGIVAQVKEDGRLRLSPIGGLSPNNAEAENVKIHTRSGKAYDGTFQLVDASWHVNPNYESTARTFDVMEVVVDERTSSAEQTRALGIEVGDFVSFDPRFTVTGSGYIKSRHLDDKLSSSILLAYAKMLKEEGRQPACRVYLHFTVYEEIGHGACAYCPADVTEVIAVDMGCVGKGISCTEHQVSICAKDSSGPSSYELVTALVNTAKAAGVDYAIDVYPFYGSDADAALRAGYDVRHCVIGAGVAASHGYERSHRDGLVNTYDLVAAYVEASGK